MESDYGLFYIVYSRCKQDGAKDGQNAGCVFGSKIGTSLLHVSFAILPLIFFLSYMSVISK